jgi:hypothetical protein
VGGEEPGKDEGEKPAKRRRARKTSDTPPAEGDSGEPAAA